LNSTANESGLYPGWLKRFPHLDQLYRRYERQVPLMVFVFGFLWDTLTMTRVDSLADHVVLSGYALLLGAMIALIVRQQAGGTLPARVMKLEPYFLWAMQFAFGGLFSSFVIFYFKSVSWSRTLLFFILCVGLLVGNEFLQHRLENRNLLAAMYSFCLFSYLALLLPTILATVHTGVFLLSGVISLLITAGVFAAGIPGGRRVRLEYIRGPMTWAFAVFAIINLLYFGDLIPPVPLALKSAGIFHHVKRRGSGHQVDYVEPPFYHFWKKSDDPFYLSTGEAAYCYSSIYAPQRIHVPVLHVWSYLDPVQGWVVKDRMSFEISGGREGGYRGFSWKRTLQPGEWRVDVETYQGRTLGRLNFTILTSPDPHPPLVSRYIP
jgi:hypothetical protein